MGIRELRNAYSPITLQLDNPPRPSKEDVVLVEMLQHSRPGDAHHQCHATDAQDDDRQGEVMEPVAYRAGACSEQRGTTLASDRRRTT